MFVFIRFAEVIFTYNAHVLKSFLKKNAFFFKSCYIWVGKGILKDYGRKSSPDNVSSV